MGRVSWYRLPPATATVQSGHGSPKPSSDRCGDEEGHRPQGGKPSIVSQLKFHLLPDSRDNIHSQKSDSEYNMSFLCTKGVNSIQISTHKIPF